MIRKLLGVFAMAVVFGLLSVSAVFAGMQEGPDLIEGSGGYWVMYTPGEGFCGLFPEEPVCKVKPKPKPSPTPTPQPPPGPIDKAARERAMRTKMYGLNFGVVVDDGVPF